MLVVTVPEQEFWDEGEERFLHVGGATLHLEHSLASLSKWESRWHKPFLGNGEKTAEEMTDYIRCMALDEDVDPQVYRFLGSDVMRQVSEYIEDPMTATWFSGEDNKLRSREVVTAEIIYYQMVSLHIPFECQNWHLNRLTTLIRVCDAKNSPPKKLDRRQVARRNAALNAARRKRLNSRG